MKKFLLLIIIILSSIFTINVNAENKCGNVTIKSTDTNFHCENNGDLTFSYNNLVYNKYFSVEGNIVSITDMEGLMASIPSSEKIITIEIRSESEVIGSINVENANYVEPTTEPSTTEPTTTAPNEISYVVTFDHNDGTGTTTERTCTVVDNNTYCNVTMPTIEGNANFSGWGTANTCKNGSTGSIRVTESTTYYACYLNQTQTSTNDAPLLKSLELVDSNTNEKINFGTFSIKNTSYEVTVLNEVKNIVVNAEADEGVEIVIAGNENLIEGKNPITIKLIKDDKETIYTIDVNRLKVGETLDKNHYLSKLEIGGYEINFNKNVLNYTVTIDNNIDELILNYEQENLKDSVTETGNSNLKNGSIIRIKLTGEEGESTEYTINIIKNEKDNTIIIIISSVIIFIILVLTVIVFVKANKKGTPPSNTNSKKDKTKKDKKSKNTKEVLPNSKEEIEILKF